MQESSPASSAQLRVVWDEEFLRYDFGAGHPMAPIRLDLTVRLAREFGLLDEPGVQVRGAQPLSAELLARTHTPDYVAAVQRASQPPFAEQPAFGLGTSDVPCFPNMHEVSARIAAGSREAALAVWHGQLERAVNLSGGLHHAMAGHASGFCVYNDAAVAIHALLDAGVERVLYVDVDVHHGDGVQAIFWDDPRVLTISVHETGQALFPGTGFPDDVGGPGAQGSAVNVALPPGTGDAAWLRAFHAVVPPLARAFAPQMLVSQHGCDSHLLDPLAHLALSLDAQVASYRAVSELAQERCAGRWLALGGGGYEVVDVVPRAWTHLIALAAGHPLDPNAEVPADWRDHVQSRLGRPAPQRMGDGAQTGYRSWENGCDPADPLDRAVLATRRAVFPLHGLDPWFD